MPPFKSNTDYTNTNYSDFTLKQDEFKNIHFIKCRFANCTFSKKTLRKCIFEECIFEGCDLNMVKLPNCRISETKFENCKMIGIDWTLTNNQMGLEFQIKESDLSYDTFSQLDISHSKLVDCKIHEADFTKSICKKVSFKGSDLTRSIFRKTNLTEADFSKAINYSFDIAASNCKGARFDQPEVLNLLEFHGVKIEE